MTLKLNEFDKIMLKHNNMKLIPISKLREYLIYLISNWSIILWYDWLIITDKWTLWPLMLVFDFGRVWLWKDETNNLAIINVDELLERAISEGYDINNLYVDVVYKN